MSAVALTDPRLDHTSSTDNVDRREELGEFLRSRRERITPDQVGLALGARRRTPGLRREEVAQLSGVGVTWYTWLEQGRDIRVSEQVLQALARTLRLDPHERLHLFTLAGAPSAVVTSECNALDPSIPLLLERLDSFPGVVLNRRYDILAHNRSYAGLIGDLDALPFDERNLLWLMFTSTPMRRSIGENWPAVSRRCAAQLRLALAERASGPSRSLVKRLSAASPEFDAVWAEHDVAPTENVVKHFQHPDLGALSFAATNLWLSERGGNRMTAYTPLDQRTTNRIERLALITPRPLY
jgi:transcriptional regulator with XRE-family HTH domain